MHAIDKHHIKGSVEYFVVGNACHKANGKEYQSYSELFDENPYDDVEELIYETDDTKKYISGTIRLFGREALTNDYNKLVTSFRYTSTQDAAN